MKILNPKISIIIPVYKVEKYINKCLDSIIVQTFTDWECILIDDGSPDNSGKICDEYVEKDSRFLVIHQKNAGVSAARNAGLNIIRGEYVTFVDSDDWVETKFLEEQYNDIVSGNYDVCICGFFGKGKVINRELSVIEAKKNLFLPDGFLGFPFLKIIKKQVIEDIRFNTAITYCEDTEFFYRVFEACNKILWTNKALYHYVDNPNSVTRLHGFTPQLLSKFYIIDKLYEKEVNKSVKYSILCYNIVAHYFACLFHIIHSAGESDVVFLQAKNYCKRNYFYFLINYRYSWKIKIVLFVICFSKKLEKHILIKYLRARQV